MKLKAGSIAFLLGCVGTGLTWLSLQPSLFRLFRWVAGAHDLPPHAHLLLRRIEAQLPFYLAIDLVALTALSWLILYFSVVRPAERMEGAIAQLGQLRLDFPVSPGGPLLSRVELALRRLETALDEEKARTREQLAELTEANTRLRRAQTELVASERLATVGKLAAGVAHEIGNPLSGILGYLSLARSRAHGPEVEDLLSRTEVEVERIAGIVRGLLDLGRPSSALRRTEPLVIGSLAQTCLQLVHADPELGGVEAELDVDPSAIVRGESGPISQVLLNLLLNAAQAMDGKGTVHLRARAEGSEVVVRVEDTGPGIPEDALPHLFDPFFTTKEAQGNGLGLAVSRHLAEQAGGSLEAENRAEGGARFTLRLPTAESTRKVPV